MTRFQCFFGARCYILAIEIGNVATGKMGTITSRKRKDNSIAYTAQIRINRDGKTVYQESQTFDRKQIAQAWIKRRETELAAPGAIDRASHKGASIKRMIDRYLDEYEVLRPMGRTKRATLTATGKTWIGEIMDSALTSQHLVEYAQWRMSEAGGASKRKPSAMTFHTSVPFSQSRNRHGVIT